MTDLASGQLILIAFGVAGTAVIAGILAGLLGVGGGIVLVPVLFWVLSLIEFPSELSMHMAVATSLATIIFTSISSARAHHKRGSIDLGLLKTWAPGIVLGALSGGLAARYFAPVDHAGIARSCGAKGLRVETAEDFAPALEDAFASDGPTIIDVVTDPRARPPLTLFQGRFDGD